MARHTSVVSIVGVAVYDVLTGSIETKLTAHSACVRDVSWHPFENTLASSSVTDDTLAFASLVNVSA